MGYYRDLPQKVGYVPKPGPRVFVVDDEHVIASSLAAILKMSGFDATAFGNPLEALDAAEVESPDLLITDVVMPQLSGIELARRLSFRHPSCKILLFSGQATTADLLLQASGKGCAFILVSKPVHPTDMLRQIGRTLAPSESIVH